MSEILCFFTLSLLGQRSLTFLGESQKKSNDNEGMYLGGPDKAIKFEKVCLLIRSKVTAIHTV